MDRVSLMIRPSKIGRRALLFGALGAVLSATACKRPPKRYELTYYYIPG